MTIGEAAELAGVSAKAVRLYERRGLVEPAERTAAGYRTYGARDIAVLRFIRQAKAVGLRLEEIGRILDLDRAGKQPCSTVVRLLDQRLADIDRTLADLTALRATLTNARRRADAAMRSGREAVVCRVIETSAS